MLQHLDDQLYSLSAHREAWARTPLATRLGLLAEIKDNLMSVAEEWVEAGSRAKGIAPGSALEGEEWLSGPCALMQYCNSLSLTLKRLQLRGEVDDFTVRERPDGQLVARVFPRTVWDRLLLSGVTADVWMQPGVTRATLLKHMAVAYHTESPGKLALVLGAGNIASIAPLDALNKLFADNHVVLLKLNPVNDYLLPFLNAALSPLIECGALAIVTGDAAVGGYLCNHPLVETIHLTGSAASHDAIVWGGNAADARANRLAGSPQNPRPITSELGAVCPTLVVPGAWTDEDIVFQAGHVATQKLHNSGFNCIATQVVMVSRHWPLKAQFIAALESALAGAESRDLYYPGARERLAAFTRQNPATRTLRQAGGGEVLVAQCDLEANPRSGQTEVFAPALCIVELEAASAEDFLRDAIAMANERLYGTLGANIIIHPASIAAMGRDCFERRLADLKYGSIAVNAWTGLGFLLPETTWGAYPGHTLADIQSGIGVVHNTLLFDKPQRSVVEAPFHPFPRGLRSRSFSLLPRPPWFISHRRRRILGRLLVRFQYRPGVFTLLRIYANALAG